MTCISFYCFSACGANSHHGLSPQIFIPVSNKRSKSYNQADSYNDDFTCIAILLSINTLKV